MKVLHLIRSLSEALSCSPVGSLEMKIIYFHSLYRKFRLINCLQGSKASETNNYLKLDNDSSTFLSQKAKN